MEYQRRKRLDALIHGNGRQDSMIRGNMEPDLGTGIHNDRIFPNLQGQPQRNSSSLIPQNMSVQGRTEQNSSIQGTALRGVVGGDHRDHRERTGEMLESNFHSAQGNGRMEKDLGRNTVEQRDISFAFSDVGSRGRDDDSSVNGLDDKSGSQVSLSSSDSIRTAQGLSSIRGGRSMLQIQGNAIRNEAFTNILHGSNEQDTYRGQKEIRGANNQLLGRSTATSSGSSNSQGTNTSYNGNTQGVWSNNFNEQMRTGTETRNNILGMDLEYNNNGGIYDQGSKNGFIGYAETTGQNNSTEQANQSQILSTHNWEAKFSQNTIQGSITLSHDSTCSQYLSNERMGMEWNDEGPNASSSRDLLVDEQNIQQQETLIEMEHSSGDSCDGCIPPGLGSDSGTENWRSPSILGNLERNGSEMDKQQEGNGGHFLRSSLFRTTLRTIGNEGDSDKVGQFFSSIQSQKTEGSTTTSFWTQGTLQSDLTFGPTDTNSTCSRSDQCSSRRTKQIGQIRRLPNESGPSLSPLQLVGHNADPRSVRKPIQPNPSTICIDRPERHGINLDGSIQSHMEERNPLDSPTYSDDTLGINDSQIGINYSDSGGTLVARATLVHNSVNRKSQVDYPWVIQPNPDAGSEYDSETSSSPSRQDSSLPHGIVADQGHRLLTKFLDTVGLTRQAQSMLIGGQKFQSIRRYYYAMATLDNWMKQLKYTVKDVLAMQPGFIVPEVMAWFTNQLKTPKSALGKQSCLKTMLSLIFNREPMHDTASTLTYRAISNCNVTNRRYAHVWDIDRLFEYWDTQPADDQLSNQDLQVKLASLLLSICFLRITEISEVDLNLSQINFTNHTALLTLLPKTSNSMEQYEVRRTGTPKLCPNTTLFTWLNRLREHFNRDVTTLESLFWNEQWKPMKIAKISEQLSLLIKNLGIEGFTAYSIKHASTTKLASLGVNERDLNVFTNHAPDSKSTKNYYVYAANRQVNDIAAKLVKIDHGPKDQDPTQSGKSQIKRGGTEAPNGDIHTLSQASGDSMMSPFGTSVPPLSHPVFLPNPSLELKIQTDTNNLSNDSFKTLTVLAQDELIYQPTETGQPTFNHMIPFSGVNKPSTSHQDVSSDRLPLKTRRSLMEKDFSPSDRVKKHK